jgi:hypothetical protein
MCPVLAQAGARNPWTREDAMPKGWSKHDEDMYEAIKESSLDRGMDKGRAEEIAARTVNKQRRQEGRTKRRSSR